MNTPSEAWEGFEADFGTVVPQYIEEMKTRQRLEEIRKELRVLEATPNQSPKREVGSIREQLMLDIDKAEAAALREQVRGSSFFSHLVEKWRTNANEKMGPFCDSLTLKKG